MGGLAVGETQEEMFTILNIQSVTCLKINQDI